MSSPLLGLIVGIFFRRTFGMSERLCFFGYSFHFLFGCKLLKSLLTWCFMASMLVKTLRSGVFSLAAPRLLVGIWPFGDTTMACLFYCRVKPNRTFELGGAVFIVWYDRCIEFAW